MTTVIKTSKATYVWDVKTSAWHQVNGYNHIKAQRVNVGKSHEQINFDLYDFNDRYLRPIPASEIEFV